MRRGNQRQVGRQRFFPVAFRNSLLALFDEALHGLARLGFRLLAQELESRAETLRVSLCLDQMFLKRFLKLRMMLGLRHFRQRLGELLFRIEQV